MARFSSLPTWWVRNLGLIDFEGGSQAGSSIAALKVVIGLSLVMDFHTKTAKNSITDIERLTGLSRPMVCKGIRALEEQGIVEINRDEHVHQYTLTMQDGDSGWAKLPYERMRKRLPELSNRGVIPLAAMKIYLLLAAWRPNESVQISVTYDRLRNETGIQKRHIRPALDILYSHSLLRVDVNAMAEQKKKHSNNIYILLGL